MMRIIGLLLLGLLAFPTMGAEPGIVICYLPDPPPAVDGQLDEWQRTAPTLVLDRADQVTFGGRAWKSPGDLSGRVWLAWREGLLYLAATACSCSSTSHRTPSRRAPHLARSSSKSPSVRATFGTAAMP